VVKTDEQVEIEKKRAKEEEKERFLARDFLNEVMADESIPSYPNIIEETPEHIEAFLKSFGVVIGKKLKKKLKKHDNLEEI